MFNRFVSALRVAPAALLIGLLLTGCPKQQTPKSTPTVAPAASPKPTPSPDTQAKTGAADKSQAGADTGKPAPGADAETEKTDAPEAKEPAPTTDAAVNAKLAKADALDGAADKVIARCASCALGMAGKPEHTFTWSGYTFHFCTDLCREKFSRDPAKTWADIEVPAK